MLALHFGKVYIYFFQKRPSNFSCVNYKQQNSKDQTINLFNFSPSPDNQVDLIFENSRSNLHKATKQQVRSFQGLKSAKFRATSCSTSFKFLKLTANKCVIFKWRRCLPEREDDYINSCKLSKSKEITNVTIGNSYLCYP